MRHSGEARSANGAARPPLRLVRWSDIRVSSAARYLVKGLLPLGGLAMVYGPPKCGKTFWLFDVLMHVVLGRPYRGRRVQQGTVIYCLFEGQTAFAARVEAFRQLHLAEDADEPPFLLMPSRIELVREHRRLVEAIIAQAGGPVAAVVLDTLNRSFTGSESSDEAMTAYVAACDAIRTALGCTVVIVHHSGLAEGRARGHTALLGSADAQIAVSRDAAGHVVATVEHMKDGPDGAEIVSRLEPVMVGTDADGEEITSCIVEPVDGPAARPRRPVSQSMLTFTQAYDEALHTDGRLHAVMQGGGVQSATVSAVPVKSVRRQFYQRWATGEQDGRRADEARKKAFQRILRASVDEYGREVLHTGEELLWRL